MKTITKPGSYLQKLLDGYVSGPKSRATVEELRSCTTMAMHSDGSTLYFFFRKPMSKQMGHYSIRVRRGGDGKASTRFFYEDGVEFLKQLSPECYRKLQENPTKVRLLHGN